MCAKFAIKCHIHVTIPICRFGNAQPSRYWQQSARKRIILLNKSDVMVMSLYLRT
jgi:hypothetical protein